MRRARGRLAHDAQIGAHVRHVLHRVFQEAHGFVEGDGDGREQDHAGEQLRHLEVLAPVGDQVADAGARGIHLGDHHAGEVEDHRDAQRLEQDRHHARHVDAREDLHARGAVGARHQHMVGLDRLDRRGRAHDDDEQRGERRVGDLLLEADAEDQDEHRQEDRFRHAEHVEQHRLEDLPEIVVLGDQHADRRAERHRDDEGDDHLGRRDGDRLVHLRRGRAVAPASPSTSVSGGSSSGLTMPLRGSVSHAARTSASSSRRMAMSWKRVIVLFLPLAPRSGERVADEVGGERGASRHTQIPLPPSLRSGTLSRKRERGRKQAHAIVGTGLNCVV